MRTATDAEQFPRLCLFLPNAGPRLSVGPERKTAGGVAVELDLALTAAVPSFSHARMSQPGRVRDHSGEVLWPLTFQVGLGRLRRRWTASAGTLALALASPDSARPACTWPCLALSRPAPPSARTTRSMA